MSKQRRASVLSAGAAIAFAAAAALCNPATPASAQGKTYIMKLSTATIHDTQQEWLERFAAAVKKDSHGRIVPQVYPASQLGSIPRQIEGVQFGSIQGWMGPPEFLVGVDQRYEALSAPGLFTSEAQDVRMIQDPVVDKLMLGLGANKGLVGVGLAPIGPSSIVTRKPIHRLADLKGLKIRVLASPFQIEMIKRMDASPVAMTLADVLPALQQGTIDGAIGTITVWTTFHYQDTAKYVVQTQQPYLNSIVVMSKTWMNSLPPDLQKIIRDDAASVSRNFPSFVEKFFNAQLKIWTSHGGVLTNLPAAEQDELVKKVSSIGGDLSKSNPALNAAVKTVFAAAARDK
jgi:TRAP-type C4-dicarboxylate transport system substrate-binding protein